MNIAPIVLFTYNRPWHAKCTVEALKKNEFADKSELVIYSDGPKDEKDLGQVSKVRDFLHKISGFKAVEVIERDKNIGLANSVITGVTDVVNQYGRIIVLEDDLVSEPDFIKFMNMALDKYEEYNQVMQISGYMFDVDIDTKTDAIFLPLISSWGWATWKRAWEKFIPDTEGYKELKNNKLLRQKFNVEGSYDYFNMLESQLKGEVNSWAIKWYLNVFMRQGLTLFPKRSLVKNIGFDGSGTHCHDLSGSPIVDIKKINYYRKDFLYFPELINVDYDVFLKIKEILCSKRSILKTVLQGISKYIK